MTRDATLPALLNAGHVFVHLLMLIFPTVVLSLGPSWGMSYDALLPLSLGGFIAYGAGSLPAGWLGDRWSRRGMMIAFFVGSGAASILTGLATGPFALATGLTLIGLCASIYHPVGIAMLVKDRNQVGRALGVNGFFGNIGIAAAALVAGTAADYLGWRAAFILPGAISVLLGIGFAMLTPADHGRPVAKQALRNTRPRRDIALRLIAAVLLAAVADSLVFNATTIAMPKVFEERVATLSHSSAEIGALVSGVYVIAALAQIWVGHLIDRHALHRILIPLASLQVVLLLVVGGTSGYLMVATTTAMMFVVFGLIPIMDAAVAKYVDDRWRSRVYAVSYVVSFGIGPAAIPLIAALHGESGGFPYLFFVLALIAVGTLAAGLVLPRDPMRRPDAAAGAT